MWMLSMADQRSQCLSEIKRMPNVEDCILLIMFRSVGMGVVEI